MEPTEAVRQGSETVRVGENAFVVHDTPLFVPLNGGQGFGLLVSLDEMRIGHDDGTRMAERFANFPPQGVFHGVKMELLLSAFV